MPGPIPIENIRIQEIDAQLGGAYGGNNLSLDTSYTFASTASGIPLGSAGMAGNFHNLAMGTGPQYNFATQIWSTWNYGYNLPVGNWGNYFFDANVVLDWEISMAIFKPADHVSIDIYLSDTPGGTGTNTLVVNISLGSDQSSVVTDFDTGIPAHSSYNNTGYWIYADMSSNITGSSCLVTIPSGTFGDSDGVGPDTGRSRRISGMPANIGFGGGPFSGVLFGGSVIGSPIAWNKRTYFALVITP